MKIESVIEKEYCDSLQGSSAVGIDIGSRATKGVLLWEDQLYVAMEPSGISSQKTADRVVQTLLGQAGISPEQVGYIVGTGYGRIAIEYPDILSKSVTEISCHAMGVHYLNKKVRTIIDIGGQDSKAIRVNVKDGKVVDFIMNDKCAAGTGRFLEKVAAMLEIDLSELGEYALRADQPIDISSQCVVFAESEVISLKARGISKENIAAGVHLATARRIKTLLRRVGFDPAVVFSGGVSNNEGMKKALEEVIGIQLDSTRLNPTYAGALGAAIYAQQYSNDENSYIGYNI